MDDMALTARGDAVAHRLSHDGANLQGARNAAAPIAHQQHARAAVDRDRRRRLLREVVLSTGQPRGDLRGRAPRQEAEVALRHSSEPTAAEVLAIAEEE